MSDQTSIAYLMQYSTTTRQMTAGAGVRPTSAQPIGQATPGAGPTDCLVSPYSQAVLDRARRYFESRYGVEVVAMEALARPTPMPSVLSVRTTPPRVYPRPGPDRGLVVPGGNFPTLRAIAAWGSSFRSVVTTNPPTLWAMMGVMKLATPLPGLGRLLARCRASRARQPAKGRLG